MKGFREPEANGRYSESFAKMMTHFKVNWLDRSDDDPILLYSELDADHFETRHIEVFADGHMDWADRDEATGEADMGTRPIPLDEFAADPENGLEIISAETFERLWQQAKEDRRRANAKVYRGAEVRRKEDIEADRSRFSTLSGKEGDQKY